MTLKEVLDRTVQFFKDKQIETPRLDTEILLTEALRYKNRVDLYLKFDQPLKDEELARSRDFVRRRVQGEPVAYIIGKKDFYGNQFQVSPAVLIPRPETELLVEAALNWIDKNQIEHPKVLDLGCGSGCIGLSVLKKNSNATLVAVDKSADALEIAKKNAELLGVADRVQFIESDVANLDLKERSFDVILSNPPYIAENDPEVQPEVKRFEPNIALFSGANGYQALTSWSQKAQAWLKNQAFMGFEMGWTQGEKMKEKFASFGVFSQVKIIKDLAGMDRHIVGEKNG
jgi:release factor glutamine methyltransferase